MELLIVIGGIVLLFMVLNLRARVQNLEQKIKTGEMKPIPEANYQPPISQPETQTQTPATSQPQPESMLTSQAGFDRFVGWIKEDWLLKLGAMLLLIAFGWLTTYAFLNNWIGPMGRIALGIIA